jgi:hypothetical protein
MKSQGTGGGWSRLMCGHWRCPAAVPVSGGSAGGVSRGKTIVREINAFTAMLTTAGTVELGASNG